MIKANITTQNQYGKYSTKVTEFRDKKHLDDYINFIAKHGTKVVGIELEYVFNETEQLLLQAVDLIPAEHPLAAKIKEHLQQLKDSIN